METPKSTPTKLQQTHHFGLEETSSENPSFDCIQAYQIGVPVGHPLRRAGILAASDPVFTVFFFGGGGWSVTPWKFQHRYHKKRIGLEDVSPFKKIANFGIYFRFQGCNTSLEAFETESWPKG